MKKISHFDYPRLYLIGKMKRNILVLDKRSDEEHLEMEIKHELVTLNIDHFFTEGIE